MATTDSVDTAVREYLLYLEDPDQLIDADRVAAIEEEIAATNDPLERVRLFSELESMQHPSEPLYRQRFVEHVKQWADDNNVNPVGFVRAGVPDDVLADAGLVAADDSTSKRSGGSSKRVSVAEVEAMIRTKSSTFSTQSLGQDSGASPMTVRRAITSLLESNEIIKLGPAPNWTQRGRAPILYQKA